MAARLLLRDYDLALYATMTRCYAYGDAHVAIRRYAARRVLLAEMRFRLHFATFDALRCRYYARFDFARASRFTFFAIRCR